MTNITNTPGQNLWATKENQTLTGKDFNDVLHAVYNGTQMIGGRGRDHFHVNMTLDREVTGTKITDFNATEGDRLVLDGITNFDANKLTVVLNSNGHDYDISYDNKFVATVNLQYTPEGKNPVDWNPGLEKATDVIKRMVRAGQADAFADYLYGTDAAQNFRATSAKRAINIVNFDPAKDKLDLSVFKSYYMFAPILQIQMKVEIKGEGDNRYVSVTRAQLEVGKITLQPGTVNNTNLDNIVRTIKGQLEIV